MSEEAGSVGALTGPEDAKAGRPASPFIVLAVHMPVAFSVAWLAARHDRPDLLCMTCEALRQGGVL